MLYIFDRGNSKIKRKIIILSYETIYSLSINKNWMLNINGNLRESDVFPRLTGRERDRETERERKRQFAVFELPVNTHSQNKMLFGS